MNDGLFKIDGFVFIEEIVIVSSGSVCLLVGGCKFGGRYLGISCILKSNSLYLNNLSYYL